MDEAGLFGSLPARLYALCALLLVLKMMALGTYTGVLRGRRKAFSSPEDYRFQGQAPAMRSDPDVERARRAHRNDLENILPFLAVGPLYVMAGPTAAGAWICFVGFTTARILHTIFYLREAMPHRSLALLGGQLVLLWMVLATGFALLR